MHFIYGFFHCCVLVFIWMVASIILFYPIIVPTIMYCVVDGNPNWFWMLSICSINIPMVVACLRYIYEDND
jgi:hypothetical protein